MRKLIENLVIPEPLHGDASEVAAKIDAWQRDRHKQAVRDFADRAEIPRRILRFIESAAFNASIKPIREAMEAVSNEKTLVLLQGIPGTGKSVAACYVLLQNMCGRYIRADRYADVAASFDRVDGRSQDFIQRSDMLVVDDAGEEPNKDHWRIERLINERYDAELPTLITTNLQPKEFAKAYKERVVSRLGEVGSVVICNKVVRPKGKR